MTGRLAPATEQVYYHPGAAVYRSDVPELHYITPISNLPSMLERGLLSHVRAERIAHDSVANPSVQGRRDPKRTPDERFIHEYVNLYINGRNRMLNRVARNADIKLCVLRIDPSVLDLPGVFVTDRNAASMAIFQRGATGLGMLERDVVFAEWWTNHPTQREIDAHSLLMQAEVLVPDRVPPEAILGAYVAIEDRATQVNHLVPTLPVQASSYLFFGLPN